MWKIHFWILWFKYSKLILLLIAHRPQCNVRIYTLYMRLYRRLVAITVHSIYLNGLDEKREAMIQCYRFPKLSQFRVSYGDNNDGNTFATTRRTARKNNFEIGSLKKIMYIKIWSPMRKPTVFYCCTANLDLKVDVQMHFLKFSSNYLPKVFTIFWFFFGYGV